MTKIHQTAGKDQLGSFAPEFAHFNDDILFGENWSNDDISQKTRSIVTISVFIGRGLVDSSLKYHLQTAKKNGVTRKEIAAIITHAAFYAGWPVAWAAFNMAKEVWTEETIEDAKDAYQNSIIFPIGDSNDAYAQYFTGQSYLSQVTNDPFTIHNVTFEPGVINHWHIHHATKGGGQMLIAVGGCGYVQLEGQDPVELKPGDSFFVPANTKHWHGAAPDSWFSHLAFMVPGEGQSNEWLEPVDETFYTNLK
ncbi:alkylhydroperoxidase/carboxymuconolactone decarboxylase family protein YurZ/quercetin dioxygenase-like cupin family protein [Lactobacillus colini]|uniref:Alkylhydroperoxidase/carboxymuconolactone decarboxylase family protein YurZ/quercetin dioxygenase-like cupin family protein n=1 Tax=Lactobacillus colini TaxID=1819254 RepID=A0ABS4MEC1_9LACO|nr:carboxymuconolactone decarboxylase family protein [Lactobacillus colini]MBP2058035.1 alkylhydroperoxidase/carboxymuconolactone decarboxylase family protein YurZ/quercetin dioxygenase-like cupin family protein [Lactobacillus colini]